MLDVGTNRKTLLDDPLYLGVRKNRLTGDAYHRVVASFVDAAESLFPDLYLHFEDFGRDHATALLREYRPRIATFNDDVQGTGIISLAGILGALRISLAVDGVLVSVVAVAHDCTPSSRRNRAIPSLMRVLTVPSGVFVRRAISRWVRPVK